MRKIELAGSAVLSAAICWHVADKVARDVLPEMLWSCNVTAVMIAVGVLLDRREFTSVGWLTFVSVAFWMWMLDLGAGATTTVASVVIHVSSPLVGALHVRRVGVWRWALAAAAIVQVVLFLISLTLTPPALNINMAHAVWSPFASWFPEIWAYHALNLSGFVLLLGAGFALCRRLGLVTQVPD